MIGLVLALVGGPIMSLHAPGLRTNNPFDADKVILLQASRACRVHEGAIYFIQHSRLDAPAIHVTHALGDTDAQITCVLQRLSGDFIARYRIDADTAPPPRQRRDSSTAEHRRPGLHGSGTR